MHKRSVSLIDTSVAFHRRTCVVLRRILPFKEGQVFSIQRREIQTNASDREYGTAHIFHMQPTTCALISAFLIPPRTHGNFVELLTENGQALVVLGIGRDLCSCCTTHR